MELSIALIIISFVLVAVPEFNKRVSIWLQGIPYIRKINASAATLLLVLGLLGLLMGWY